MKNICISPFRPFVMIVTKTSFSCYLPLIFLAITQTGCEYQYFEPVNVTITDTVSFASDIVPIFTLSCALADCHTAGKQPPDLTPSNAYVNLWMYNLIDTLNPEQSELYLRMNSSNNPMPPSSKGGKLPPDKIAFVKTWIEQGAVEN